MKDRIPKYPLRFKITEVSGSQNLYDLERADSPIQDGTPLNKQTLLPDDVAQMYGLGDDATPADVFRKSANGMVMTKGGGENSAYQSGTGSSSIGNNSFATGINTVANGNGSHSEGIGTVASKDGSHAEGKYNAIDSDGKYIHIIGNGSSESDRRNAYALEESGNAYYSGSVECKPPRNINGSATSGYVSNKLNYIINSDMTFISADFDEVDKVITSEFSGFESSAIPPEKEYTYGAYSTNSQSAENALIVSKEYEYPIKDNTDSIIGIWVYAGLINDQQDGSASVTIEFSDVQSSGQNKRVFILPTSSGVLKDGWNFYKLDISNSEAYARDETIGYNNANSSFIAENQINSIKVYGTWNNYKISIGRCAFVNKRTSKELSDIEFYGLSDKEFYSSKRVSGEIFASSITEITFNIGFIPSVLFLYYSYNYVYNSKEYTSLSSMLMYFTNNKYDYKSNSGKYDGMVVVYYSQGAEYPESETNHAIRGFYTKGEDGKSFKISFTGGHSFTEGVKYNFYAIG